MAYVVVVFCMINALALGAVGWYLRECWRDLPTYVGTAIQDEVRKQDDRIEKRLAKREDAGVNEPGSVSNHEGQGLVVGQPYRR